eukprot:Colp12_sorted_trinity150504_noHs@13415
MVDAARALMDELMGRDRDLLPEEKPKRHWSDSNICKHYLCGLCPCELFKNTKSDLGACDREHDDSLKEQYEKSSRRGRMGFEEDWIRRLESIIGELDRKIRKNLDRLALEATEVPDLATANNAKQEKIRLLGERISNLLQQVETLGADGKVEESMQLMKIVEQLQADQKTIEENTADNGEKKHEVCLVCGALLTVGEAQTRVDAHLQGKQHIGYALIRDTITSFRESNPRGSSRPMPAVAGGANAEPIGRRPSRDVDRDRDAGRDRDRDRDHRERRDRDRDRDRPRDYERDYDRDRRRERRRSRSRSPRR